VNRPRGHIHPPGGSNHKLLNPPVLAPEPTTISPSRTEPGRKKTTNSRPIVGPADTAGVALTSAGSGLSPAVIRSIDRLRD
jgi:hypothetical protein